MNLDIAWWLIVIVLAFVGYWPVALVMAFIGALTSR